MECTVSWTGASGTRSAMGFVAETGSGHVIGMDGAPDSDKPDQSGQNMAARPMELLLAGAGGCTAYDVVLMRVNTLGSVSARSALSFTVHPLTACLPRLSINNTS